MLSTYCREKFIPITRRSVIRHLMQEKNFLTEKEQKDFEKLALALDAAIINRHHDILQDLKVTFAGDSEINVSKRYLLPDSKKSLSSNSPVLKKDAEAKYVKPHRQDSSCP